MRSLRSFVFATIAAAMLLPLAAQAQDLHPSRRTSPVGVTQTHVGEAYVKITYGRPYKRDRDNIFGASEDSLVQFGQVWRTGANEATEITVTGDVKIAGQALSAGTYSLFTTPGANSWKVHFNSDLGLWGTFRFNRAEQRWEQGYKAEHDVLVVEVKPATLEEEVDQFTIELDSGEDGTDIVLQWINTEVRIPVSAE